MRILALNISYYLIIQAISTSNRMALRAIWEK